MKSKKVKVKVKSTKVVLFTCNGVKKIARNFTCNEVKLEVIFNTFTSLHL